MTKNKKAKLEVESNFSIPYMVEDITKSLPFCKLNKNKIFFNDFMKDNPWLNINELNSLNYRCDEFIKNHSGEHLLFAGCSYTWGTGLLINETWSKQLYDLIAKDKKLSGYFNLSFPGSSNIDQIINIFKYIKNYGIPSHIFINLTEPSRMYSYVDDFIIDSRYTEDSLNILNIINYQYLYMLNEYCIANDIKLHIFTWDQNTFNKSIEFREIIKKSFNNFYTIIFNLQEDYVNNFINNNKEYSRLARDNHHFGYAYHKYWAKIMYNAYKGNE